MKFYQECQLIKAEPLNNGSVEVTLKISTEKKDKQNEVVLKSAFAKKQTIDNFIKEGIYDYNHLTDILEEKCLSATGSELVELQLQKSRAIIGSPYKDERGLYVQEDGVYSKGKLIPDNEFSVQIIKGLRAGLSYGASISGLALKSANNSVIDNIMLKKVAIQPLQESINNDTYIQLAKSNIFSLDKIIKGEYLPYNTSRETIQPVIKSTESLLERKVNMMYNWFLEFPEVQEKISQDIVARLQSKSLPMEYEPILTHCINEYSMPELGAKTLANGILLNISPEDFF